jgi:plasmid stability protein
MSKEEQINIRNVPADLKRRAQIQAIEQGKSLSEVVRELLDQWTKEQGQQKQSPTKK